MKNDADIKLLSRNSLVEIVNDWRKEGITVAFTNGVFDILHAGHLLSLEKAAEFCDKLVVGINTDSSTRRLGKGQGRPLNSEHDRARLIGGLTAVDAVTLFNEDTPFELLAQIKPDVLVKGGDYRYEDVVGREFAGRVEIIELLRGISTTSLIRRIRNLPEHDTGVTKATMMDWS